LNIEFYLNSLGSLAPYGILLLVYFLLAFQSEVLRNRFFALPALGALLIFAGFREAITPDMEQYRILYEDSRTLTAGFIEPTFLYLCKFLNALGFDYHALFFVYSLITLFFIYLAIRNYCDDIRLPLLLYVLIPGCFLNMFVEMREVCAISIALYATSQLKLLAILSALFHYSAILYWAIFLVLYKSLKRTHSTFLYLFLIITSLIIPTSILTSALQTVASPFVPAKYQAYIDMFSAQSAGVDSAQLLKSLIYVILAILIIYSKAFARNEESDSIQLNLFVVGVLLLNLSRSNAVLSRVAYYFLIQQIVLLPEIVSKIDGQIKRLMATYCLVLFYLAQFAWGLFYFSPEEGYIFLHYRNALLAALK
jgi:transmembrane protein EpsG